MWPDLVIVHGKPHHPKSQGSVERANGDVEDMLQSWLNDHKTTEWYVGLKFVQLQKNTAQNRIMETSPYRALFGRDLSIGLRSDFPNDVLEHVCSESEEDLQWLCATNTNLQEPMTDKPRKTRLGSQNRAVSTHRHNTSHDGQRCGPYH